MSCLINRWIYAYSESSFGTAPTSPTRVFIPVEAYDVDRVAESRQSRPFIGRYDSKHARTFKGHLAGEMSGALYGYVATGTTSLAKYILDWAFAQDGSQGLDSKGIEYAQGDDDEANVLHAGMRVNSFTLQGDEDSGRIEYSANLIGKVETALANHTDVPVDMEDLVEFDFADSSLTIDTGSGATATEFRAFSITREHAISLSYNANRSPSMACKTQEVTTMTLELYKEDDTYDAYARDYTSEQDLDIALTLKGSHNGSGASGDYTQIVIDIPKARIMPVETRWDNPAVTVLNLAVLKPDVTEEAISFTYSLV